MKLVTHKKQSHVHGHVELRPIQERFRSLGLNNIQISAILTDPVIAPKFFRGDATIVIRDCSCCGDKQVFAMAK